MIVAVLFITLAQIAPSSAPAVDVRTERRSLELPREIAPAVFPYFKCTMDGMNSLGPVSTGEEFRRKKQRAVANCSQVRAIAKAAALNMLSRTDMATAKREAFVEEALTSIDRAQDDVADRLDAPNVDRTSQD